MSTEPETTIDYRCTSCGVFGQKLWRQYQTIADACRLLCLVCAERDQGEPRHPGSDAIGWLVPAIPVDDTFWGYTSVPDDGCRWWYALPPYLHDCRGQEHWSPAGASP